METIYKSPWLSWEPKASNNTETPEREPSKPTKPSIIAGRKVDRIYFQDGQQIWFKDADGRFWHYSLPENELSELIPRDSDAEMPLSRNVCEAIGTLLGFVILTKMKQNTDSQSEE